MEKQTSIELIKLLENNTDGLKVSVNIIYYLEKMSLEEYKSALAYLNWQQKGHPHDNNIERMKADWCAAELFIRNYLNVYSFEPCDSSVKEYLHECRTHRNELSRVKAYWLYLTRKGHEADEDNYRRAAEFVDSFYDNVIPAIDGDSGKREMIKNLLLNNEQIANMVEANIFRIKEIVPTPAH